MRGHVKQGSNTAGGSVEISSALPHRLGVLAIVFALIGAVKFTNWYPTRSGAR